MRALFTSLVGLLLAVLLVIVTQATPAQAGRTCGPGVAPEPGQVVVYHLYEPHTHVLAEAIDREEGFVVHLVVNGQERVYGYFWNDEAAKLEAASQWCEAVPSCNWPALRASVLGIPRPVATPRGHR